MNLGEKSQNRAKLNQRDVLTDMQSLCMLSGYSILRNPMFYINDVSVGPSAEALGLVLTTQYMYH